MNELEKELSSNKKRVQEIQKMEKENSRLQEQLKNLNAELAVCFSTFAKRTEIKKLGACFETVVF